MSSTRLKQCYRCKQLKPVTDFSPNRNLKSGYASNCKPCTNAYKRHYHANVESAELREARLRKVQERDADVRAELEWFREKFPGLARKKPWLDDVR